MGRTRIRDSEGGLNSEMQLAAAQVLSPTQPINELIRRTSNNGNG
jgi:hypothetical protein